MPDEVFSPELGFGSGCDLAIVSHQQRTVLLVEVKRSSLSWSDTQKAIRQLGESEDRLRTRYSGYRFEKSLVHDKRKGCSTYAMAVPLLESAGVRYLNTAHSKKAKRLRNLYLRMRRRREKEGSKPGA